MLDPLASGLSRTRQISNNFNGMSSFSPSCPRLISRDKEQGGKKLNEINACSLSRLVPLKSVAGAVQAAPLFRRLPLVRVVKENYEGLPIDKLSVGRIDLQSLLTNRRNTSKPLKVDRCSA